MTIEMDIYLSRKRAELMEDYIDEDDSPFAELAKEYAISGPVFKVELRDNTRHDPPLGHQILRVSCEGTQEETDKLCSRLLHLVM